MDDAEDRYLDSLEQAFLEGEVQEMPSTCKYCGKAGLYWEPTKWGSRLADEQGKLHCCREYLQYHRLNT